MRSRGATEPKGSPQKRLTDRSLGRNGFRPKCPRMNSIEKFRGWTAETLSSAGRAQAERLGFTPFAKKREGWGHRVFIDHFPSPGLGGSAFPGYRRHRFLLRLRFPGREILCRSAENLLRRRCRLSPRSREWRGPRYARARLKFPDLPADHQPQLRSTRSWWHGSPA